MMKLYKSYVFVDKDPAIDEIRTHAQNVLGQDYGKRLKSVEADGGPTASCMRGWFFGKTRRPQNATLEAAGRAMGYKRVWVDLTRADKAAIQQELAKPDKKRKRGRR